MANPPLHINQIDVRTNLRPLRSDDLTIQEVLHCEPFIANDGQDPIVRKSIKDMTPDEHNAVRRAMLKHAAKDAHIVTNVRHQSLLARPDDEPSIRRHSENKWVVLTIYNSKDKPPKPIADFDYVSACTSSDSITFESDASPFKSSQMSADIPQWRWCRTVVITVKSTTHPSAIGKELQVALRALTSNDSKHVLSASWFPINIYCHSLKTEDLLKSLAAGQDFVYHSNEDQPDDFYIYIKMAQLSQIAAATKASQLPPPVMEQIKHGLKLLLGKTQGLHSQSKGGALVAESPHVYVMHMDRPNTLADFIQHQCGSAAMSPSALLMLNGMLKGVKVVVGSGNWKEERTITAVWNTASVPPQSNLRHRLWSSDLLLPDLPCINVGTPDKPVLLPPELCFIVKEQQLRGSHPPSLQRFIQYILEMAESGFPQDYQSNRGRVVPLRQRKKSAAEVSASLQRACGGRVPTILFLEVGSEDAEPSIWASLRIALKDVVRGFFPAAEEQESDHDYPVLALSCDKVPDMTKLWTQQLRQYVLKHQVAGRQTIVVVCLPSEKMHTGSYNIIKKACDQSAGAQSISVCRRNVEHKFSSNTSNGDPSTGARLVAGDILRRLRLSNTLMLSALAKTQAPEHLVVAMHVTLFSPQTQCVDDAGKLKKRPELMLTILVSRAIDSSEGYHTEAFITSKKRSNEAGIFEPFFNKFDGERPRALTVLRSGYQVDGNDSKHREALEDEEERVLEVYKKDASHGTFTYIKLSEDKLLKLQIDKEALPEMDDNGNALVITHRASQQNSDKTFTHDLWVQNVHKKTESAAAVKVAIKRVLATSTVASESNLAGPSHPQNATAATAPGLLSPPPPKQKRELSGGIDLHAGLESGIDFSPSPAPGSAARDLMDLSLMDLSFPEDPDSPSPNSERMEFRQQKQRANNLPVRSSNDSAAPSTTTGSPPKTSGNSSTASSDITSHINTLAELWKDEHLELYGTRWPIPTHLAHLASKRALLHLSTDYQADARRCDTTPVFLPPVHERVRNSLYYL